MVAAGAAIVFAAGVLAMATNGGSHDRSVTAGVGQRTTTSLAFGASDQSNGTDAIPGGTVTTTASSGSGRTATSARTRTGGAPATSGASPMTTVAGAPVCQSTPADIPTQAGIYVVGMGDGTVRHLQPQHWFVGTASVSPDGTVAVVTDTQNNEMLMDLATGNVITTYKSGTFTEVTWSHDGQRLLTDQPTSADGPYPAVWHHVIVTDRSGTVLKDFGQVSYQISSDLEWSPDESTIVQTSVRKHSDDPIEGVRLINVADGSVRELTKRAYDAANFAPDGRQILASRVNNVAPSQYDAFGVDLVAVSDGAITSVRPGGRDAAYTDHGTIAVQPGELGLVDIPIGGGAERPITGEAIRSFPIVSPGGRYTMAYVWPKGGQPDVELYAVDTRPGGCARLVARSSSAVLWGGWLPNGRGFIVYPNPPG